jgi:hypothetical protein
MTSIPYIVDVIDLDDDTAAPERHVVRSVTHAYILMLQRSDELRRGAGPRHWAIGVAPLADSDLPELTPALDEHRHVATLEARLRALAAGEEDIGDALRDAIYRQAEAERLQEALTAARDARDEAIRAALATGRVSQREVATALDLSAGMIARIASGRRVS